ncbi:MAG: PAS domain S-box protein [Candidatus Riflemargulisbacteria bacterium]
MIKSFLHNFLKKEKTSTNLLINESIYQELIDLAVDSIIVGDSKGNIIYANSATLNLFEVPLSQIVNKHINQLSWEPKSISNNPFRFDLVNAGETIRNIRTICKPDKNERIVEMSSKLMASGNYKSILRDITEQKIAETAIIEKENNYRLLVESIKDGIIKTDEKGKIVIWNNSAEKIFGLLKEEAIGKYLWDIQYQFITPDKKTPDFYEDLKTNLLNYLTNGKLTDSYSHQNVVILKKDGTTATINSSASIIPTSKGFAIASIISDITERKKIENNILQRESYLRAIIENQPGLVWLKNEKGQFLSVNQAFATSCCIDNPELLLGKTDFDVWPKDLAQKYIEDDNNLIKTRQALITEELILDKGEIKWFETFKKPVFNKNNEIIGTTGYALDITDRKKIETAIFQEKRLFEYVVESLPVMLFLKDAKELRFALMNRTGEKLLGITKEELLGKNDFDFFPKEQAEFFIKKDRETLSKKENIDISEEPIQTHDKGERILRTLKVPVMNTSGEAEFLLGFSIDITDQKIAEKEHTNLQAQLAQSKKLESVGQLAGGIAHDFNNMLGVILGQTELALKKADSKNPIYQSLLEIKNAAERSSNLTKQLLAFARKQPMSPKLLDLNKTILDMMSLLRSLVGENILLTWVPNKDVDIIKIDPSQLDQILANLCINAKEAIKNTGEISIETCITCFDEKYCKTNTDYLPGNYVQLIITDNGCGMNKETISKIFEPFFTTKELGKGTGLGLSTVYGIVKQNHGFITVNSTPGTGTIFNIYLPKHSDEIPENTKKPNILKNTKNICDKQTILLVEDEPMVREMTVGMLELQGHTVIQAESAEEALKIAQSNPIIDLLITDLIMPNMNGRELSNKILSIYPNIKCLFMSGYTADVIAKHGVLENNIHFIEKPFTLDTLSAKIQEALEK